MNRTEGVRPSSVRDRLQKVAFQYAGPVRDGSGLEKALAEANAMKQELAHVYVQTKDIEYNPEWISAIQLENMLMVFEMVVRASLLRKESRGAMYRRDYVKTTRIG
jgi:succinate dehydrogenase/fumarate reductase flavoprotein subunit